MKFHGENKLILTERTIADMITSCVPELVCGGNQSEMILITKVEIVHGDDKEINAVVTFVVEE